MKGRERKILMFIGVFDKDNGGGFLDEIYPTA